jgi:hypothetical protein
MKYPIEVEKRIKFLNERYEEDQSVDTFHILHLYPGKIAYPNGYIDSRFFTLWGFNTDKMLKKNLGIRDGLDLTNVLDPQESPKVNIIRIFADGSTLIRFLTPVKVSPTQCADVYIHDRY